jgi:hypothetical protein
MTKELVFDSLLYSIETDCGAKLTSCPMGTGPPSPTVKAIRGVKLTAYFNLMLKLRMSEVMSSPPHTASWCAA